MATRPRIIRAPLQRETPSAHDAASENTSAGGEDLIDPDFDETTYLRAFPDIAEDHRPL